MAYADWRRGDLSGTKGEALLVFHYSQGAAPRARSHVITRQDTGHHGHRADTAQTPHASLRPRC